MTLMLMLMLMLDQTQLQPHWMRRGMKQVHPSLLWPWELQRRQ
jgi:hypothetical protein